MFCGGVLTAAARPGVPGARFAPQAARRSSSRARTSSARRASACSQTACGAQRLAEFGDRLLFIGRHGANGLALWLLADGFLKQPLAFPKGPNGRSALSLQPFPKGFRMRGFGRTCLRSRRIRWCPCRIGVLSPASDRAASLHTTITTSQSSNQSISQSVNHSTH